MSPRSRPRTVRSAATRRGAPLEPPRPVPPCWWQCARRNRAALRRVNETHSRRPRRGGTFPRGRQRALRSHERKNRLFGAEAPTLRSLRQYELLSPRNRGHPRRHPGSHSRSVAPGVSRPCCQSMRPKPEAHLLAGGRAIRIAGLRRAPMQRPWSRQQTPRTPEPSIDSMPALASPLVHLHEWSLRMLLHDATTDVLAKRALRLPCRRPSRAHSFGLRRA